MATRPARSTRSPKPVPDHVVGPDGIPRFGAYCGIPDAIEFGGLSGPYSRDRLNTFLRHKRWMYVFAETDDLIVAAAIVDAGLTGTAFAMVADRHTGEAIADASRPGGMRPLVGVNSRPLDGHSGHYFGPGTAVTTAGSSRSLRLRATLHRMAHVPFVSKPWLELDVVLDTSAHEGLTAVAELDLAPPLASCTVKNAALPTRGSVALREAGDVRDWSLAGGLGGFDYTSGYLPRSTSWRWAFGTGTIPGGRTIGMNLVSGFTGIEGRAVENGIWIDGRLALLDPDAQIDYDEDDPLGPWRVKTSDGAVDLTFEPIAVHREGINLGLMRSYFMQPAGHFRGTVKVGGETIQIERLPGVVENQDVLW